MAVHVPFYIGNTCLIQDLSHGIDDVVPDRRIAQIKYQLIAAHRRFLSRSSDGILRVFPVELAVRIDHLRFEPKPEIKPEPSYPAYKMSKAAGQLFTVYSIVAETCLITVPFAEPAIVEHK